MSAHSDRDGNRDRVWEWLEATAFKVVERLVEALPEELREPAAGVAVFFEPEDPEGEDLLGRFEGASLLDEIAGDAGSLPRITLFLANLWEMCEGDRGLYREEVRVTFLHELGHYFGWGEEEVEERGLG